MSTRPAAFVDKPWTRALCLGIVAAVLVLAAPAQAHTRAGDESGPQRSGRAAVPRRVLGREAWRFSDGLATPAQVHAHRIHPAANPCQTLTVVNQANVQSKNLALVEFAFEIQAEQLSAAWGTPCVQWGPGGWDVYLQTGYQPLPGGGYTMKIGGDHYGAGVPGPDWAGQPYAIIDTGAATYQSWSYAFSHEISEMLVDSNDATYYTWPNGTRQLLEICDPVEGYTYQIVGVTVDDFTLPAAWSGAAGPYDEAGDLSAPLTPGATLGL